MTIELSADVTALLKDGLDLIPAIAQDAATGEVLMMAYMNHESLAITINTGRATYWSRSRNELWGERCDLRPHPKSSLYCS